METEFARKIQQLLRAAEESVPPLAVLVWGPSRNDNDPWWLKRVEIRTHLRDSNCEAHFSEELPGGTATAGDARQIALRTAEMAHAIAADFIIVLMGSVGSVSEFHDFGSRAELARKMLVFINRDHLEGYAVKSILPTFQASNGRVEAITVPDDLTACKVRTIALAAVDDIWQLKLYEALEVRANE